MMFPIRIMYLAVAALLVSGLPGALAQNASFSWPTLKKEARFGNTGSNITPNRNGSENFRYIAEKTSNPVLSESDERLKTWSTQIDEAEKVASDRATSNEKLRLLPSFLENIRNEIRKFQNELKPKREEIKTSLSKLGPPPKDDAPQESPEIAEQRNALQNEFTAFDSLVKQSELLLTRAGQIIERANAARRERFASSLFKPVPNYFSTWFWQSAISEIPNQLSRAYDIVQTWLVKLSQNYGWRFILLFGIPVLAGIFISVILRRTTGFFNFLYPEASTPLGIPDKSAIAVFETLILVIPIFSAVMTFYLILNTLDQLSPKTDLIVRQILLSISGLIYFLVLIRKSIDPKDHRTSFISNVRRYTARKIAVYLSLLACVWFFNKFFSIVDEALLTTYTTIVLRNFIVAILCALLLYRLIRIRFHTGTLDEAHYQYAFGEWPIWIYIPVLSTITAILVTLVSGYVALASFIGIISVPTAGIISTLFLLHFVAEKIATLNISSDSSPALYEDEHATTSGMLGMVFGLIVDVFLLAIGIPLLLLQWSLDGTEIHSWIVSAFYGFQIGGFTFSIQLLMIAVIIFAVGLIITRIVQKWFVKRSVLIQTSGTGIRESVRLGLGYVGLILSLLAAISYLGIDFTNVAIVAGALSVGIGFGLQSIFNNFISGIILLVERPIKVGDYIFVGSNEGTVRKINVRATELETLEKQSIIVPNSELISGVVKNWMHGDRLGRIVVPVGVSYNSDVILVRDILLKQAHAHPRVRKFPEPNVFFAGYGDSSLDFELRVFLSDISQRISVTSDLRFSIWQALREAKVEIPFPQRDVHLKDIEVISKLLSA